MNNMGPGLADVGPSRNFGELSVLSKYVLMFDMLAGRLELFPMLVLFHPVLWKETWAGSKRKRRRSRREKERLQSKYKISAIVGRHKDVRRRPGRRDK